MCVSSSFPRLWQIPIPEQKNPLTEVDFLLPYSRRGAVMQQVTSLAH